MAKIHTLKILNHRGIRKFEQVFVNSNFICLIGRGDSGKTTILNAISAVLSPNWKHPFYDTDFYRGNIENTIEIEASLYDLPNDLLTDSKYGLYKRLLNTKNEIIDDVQLDESIDFKDILTIKLIVDKNLEPKWFIINDRLNQENIEINANDRAKINAYLVSDFLDRHFSWSKGTPLFSLLKTMEITNETDNILTEANRKAKEIIKTAGSFNSFDTIISKIIKAAVELGLPISELEALIDFKDTLIKDGNITLHNDGIPFRLKGKGTRRLLSVAIQLEIVKQGGIVLIDEIEQGLEPDRARFLVKKLRDINQGQIFITTHSNNVLVELDANNIFLMNIGSDKLFSFSTDFQGCIRKNPEAFFSKKIIVCEGLTEIGICRALNNFRIMNGQNNLAVLGVALADGTGSNFKKYCENFKASGYDVCAFCDSDDMAINKKKKGLLDLGIKIVDCDENKSIEQQLFNDLPWDEVKELLKYAISEKSEQSILMATGKSSLNELILNDNTMVRDLMGIKAKEMDWFKRIDHGQIIGKIWFNSLSSLGQKTLKDQFEKLTNWVNE
jgi:putative ATP-dependent endonuclease of the OLD family